MASQLETDAAQLKVDAVAALSKGRKHFTPVVITSYFRSTASRGLDDWAYFIDIIEEAGWHLDQWTVFTDPKAGLVASPVFVRADEA
ncbi:MAG: hypothetical protein ABIO06_08800 [Pseudolysinimonas sp.]